jgi:tRNA(fMet)-specific endonuclease VapC
MLDTDISSYLINENNKTAARNFQKHEKDTICISSVTYTEITFGALNRKSQNLRVRIKNFMSLVKIVDFGKAAADEYALLRAFLNSRGTPVGNMDMLIAATAKASGAVLVTNNEKHFSLIPDLVVENWC